VLVVAALSVSAGFALKQATSESYPNGDIDLVVPAAAGETTDTVARAVAPCLADELGVGVVVRNVPGEHGVLGNQVLADATSERTLMVSSAGPTVVTPYLLPERPYVLDEFGFLGVVRTAPVVLFTAADSAVDSAASLLAAAKAGGPPVTVANPGDETIEGFTLWHLNFLGKTQLTSTPVDSDAAILRGVLAGDHTAGIATLTPDLLAGIRSGAVRLLASGGHERPEYLPEVPTIYEVVGQKHSDAVPDLVIDTLFSAPILLGDDARSTLSSALAQCVGTGDVRRAIGAEFVPGQVEMGDRQFERLWSLGEAVQQGLQAAGT
jgi:tripartite-type tricarboxylate transporter receptor subunit TctC